MTLQLFFDLDGTLTDPKQGIVRSIRHALECLGSPAAEHDDLTWCIGPPLIDSFAALLGDRADAERALARYRERFTETGLYENRVYAGIPETLARLQAAGHRLYVATSKPETFALRIVEHFGLAGYLDRIFGSELDGTRSDKGDLLAHALEQIAAPPGSSLMIGDRRHDIEAARRHGLRSIGVVYGYGGREELAAAGADALARTPEDIVQLVRRTPARRQRGSRPAGPAPRARSPA